MQVGDSFIAIEGANVDSWYEAVGQIEKYPNETITISFNRQGETLNKLNSKEPPVMDGSSKDFVSALKEGVIVEQKAKVDFLEITKPVVYNDEEKDVEVLAVPFDGYM